MKRTLRRAAERAGGKGKATAEEMIASFEIKRRRGLGYISEQIAIAREQERVIAELRAIQAGEERYNVPPPSHELLQAIQKGLGADYAHIEPRK